MGNRIKDKVLRSKRLRVKFAIYMIFIILITSFYIYEPVDINAANNPIYKTPKLVDQSGNEWVIDWSNAVNDNIMKKAMEKNKKVSLEDNLIPIRVKRKDNPNIKSWANLDISNFDFGETITNRNGTYIINGFLLADRGLVVYGLPEEVPNNDFIEDRYRYLGFDINGQPYSNIDFPNDVSSGLHPKDKHWIYRPWEDERVKNSKNGISRPSIYYKTQKEQAKQWLSTMVWQDPNTGKVTRAVDDGYTPDELLETFHIQSPPSKYTNGTARGWHDTYVN